VNLVRLVWTMHSIYKVRGLNPDHLKKNLSRQGFCWKKIPYNSALVVEI